MSQINTVEITKKSLGAGRYKRRAVFVLFAVFLCLGIVTLGPKVSYAACSGCVPGDAEAARRSIAAAHTTNKELLKQSLNDEFKGHQKYSATTLYGKYVMPAMQAFTKQMTSIAMQQMLMIGGFFDAKQQLETQLLFQKLQVQAHKDYQPSKDFCYFGTNVRSLAASEQVSHFNTLALNARQMKRHLGSGTSGSTPAQDKFYRWRQFSGTYCDVRDNAWPETDYTKTGLYKACNNGGPVDKTRINNDIDYTRLIDRPRTLDVAFYEERTNVTGVDPFAAIGVAAAGAATALNPFAAVGAGAAASTTITGATATEEDVFAMGNNLFGHDVMPRYTNTELSDKENQKRYMALRSVTAKRNVAENSFNAIVGLKSSGSKAEPGATSKPETRKFLAAVMKELGVPEDEIYDLIGDDPSYYAQLEILAKKIYQTPNFFADLYDKPANVERKSVALKAIELMLDRAIYESQLRQEMSMSVLLSSKLESEFKEVSTALGGDQ